MIDTIIKNIHIFRISIVSGFMPQEVSGQLAFTYMHKEDVRWVMIALRQSKFSYTYYICFK